MSRLMWRIRVRLAALLVRWAGRLNPNRPLIRGNPDGSGDVMLGGMMLAHIAPGDAIINGEHVPLHSGY